MKKFVIVATPRSGSEFLRSLLGSVDGVSCKSELLQENFLIDNGMLVDGNYTKVQNRNGVELILPKNPRSYVDYIERELSMNNSEWMTMYSEDGATGFKIIYHLNIIDNPNIHVLKHFIDDDFYFIRLKRINMLEQYISYIRAIDTNQWHIRNDDALVDVDSVIVKLELFQKWVNGLLFYEKHWDAYFTPYVKNIDVIYEDLSKDPLGTVKSICDFMDIDCKFLPDELTNTAIPKKIASAPISEVVVNYDELKTFYKGKDYYDRIIG